MTAEIAVMNKGAIALAADSKVTVTGGGTPKTYDTVNKLFTLSKGAPVGVMVYGNAEFMGYPWETIIKIYREQNRRQTFNYINDWSEDFFRFLGKFGKIKQTDIDSNVKGICQSIIVAELNRYHDTAMSLGVVHGTPDYEAGLLEHFKSKVTQTAKAKAWGSKPQQTALIKWAAKYVVSAVQRYLKDYSEDIQQQALVLLVGTLMLQRGSPQMSGVVVAGFGDNEYFPTLIEHEVDGYVGKRIKRYKVLPDVDVSRSNQGCIRPFAQKEMVQRFMNGIDPAYGLYVMNGAKELVVDNCLSTLEKYGLKAYKSDKVREDIRDAVNKAFKDFGLKAQNYSSERFSDPVMRMVALLPKDELAHLAESLVALTSLKRRVSSDAETVGGPIDVALISKGDGFVWIKRKHYFSVELNPQFIRTYMDRTGYGEKDEERGSARSRRGTSKARPSRRRGAAGGKASPTDPMGGGPGTGGT